MQLSNDFKLLGEFIGGLLGQQKKEIVEEIRKEIKSSQKKTVTLLRGEMKANTDQLRKEIHTSQEQTIVLLRKEIKTSQEQTVTLLRKEIKTSQEQTVKDMQGYFEENVLPLLGEYDVRLEHQEAHTSHPPGTPTGL